MVVVSASQEFLVRTRDYISPRSGLIRRVLDLCRERDDALLYFAATIVANTSRYGQAVDCPQRNGGAGLTQADARVAAIGETLERYCCSVYQPEDLRYASYHELEGPAVHPSELACYSDAQLSAPGFPFKRFTEESRVRWRQGVRMGDGVPVWYPAGLAHVPYKWGADETVIAPCVSTGMALGGRPLDAAMSGLCEVIERDALMITWWNELPAPEVKVPEDSWLGRVMQERFDVPGVRFRLFDITCDIRVPTIFCTAEEIQEREDGCAIAVGAASRPDPVQASLKALVEAAQTRHYARFLVRRDGPIVPDAERLMSLDDHVRFYARSDTRHAFDFLHSNDRSVNLPDLPHLVAAEPAGTLRRCVQTVQEAGLEPLAMDLTPPDVAEHGLAAVKVIVPGMVDLNPWHSLRWLGSRRLFEVPVTLGFRSAAPTGQELNPNPHPFP